MITKICAISKKEFFITDEDLAFYEKIGVPAPTLCPEERARRRYAWRNERNLYWRKCDKTGEKILSIYSKDKPFKTYNTKYWYSQDWDPKDYGRDFDFSRPFFPQFKELIESVPQLAKSSGSHSENSEYTNQADYLKDCFWVFESSTNQSCLFCTQTTNSNNCCDSTSIDSCELCYECIDCLKCYNSSFLQNCQSCSDSWFLKNCTGCKNCFGSSHLKHKEYYFLNEKYSKEDYFSKIKSLELGKQSKLKNMRANALIFFQKFPQKFQTGFNNENSSGNYLNNTQNCQNCFDLSDAQDCKNIFYAFGGLKMVHDLTVYGNGGVEFCYENHEIGEQVQNICFSEQIWEGCSNIFYSKLCMYNSHNLFGCMGLKHEEFCILNKKYSKEEYFSLRKKIIEHMKMTGEWGEFFPLELSPFGYNETIAQDFFPLSKEAALSQNIQWKDLEKSDYQKQAYLVPNSIEAVNETIIETILACKADGKNFKIQSAELAFYKKMSLPIPHFHPEERHKARMKLRNPPQLYDRKCGECLCAIQTTFTPDQPEKILCEECYLKITH